MLLGDTAPAGTKEPETDCWSPPLSLLEDILLILLEHNLNEPLVEGASNPRITPCC